MNRQAPPQDLAAEQGVLGAILAQGRDIVSLVSPLLDAEHFYDRRHGMIWLAAHQLWDRGEPVDEITVAGYLAEQGTLDSVGGPDLLAALANVVLAPEHAEHYARTVRGKAMLRRMVAAAGQIIESAGRAHDVEVALAEAQRLINQAAAGGQLGAVQSTAQVLGPVFAAYQDRHSTGGRDDRALPTGFRSLDGLIGGLRPGKLIIPAGRPGMGKTSWMLSLAANVAIRQGRPVLFATKEQPPAEMVDWLVCSEGQVNTQAWASGRTTPQQHRSAEVRREVLERAPLYWLRVRERGDRALRSLMSHARSLQASKGLALVCVDYIQIMSLTRTRHEDISEISGGLKELGMELEVPVVAAAQLSREVERREDKRPVLSDLKGSGSLEEDADMAMLFYRPAYYDRASSDNSVQVGIAKHRGGPCGMVRLQFDAGCVRFWDEANSQQPQGRLI